MMVIEVACAQDTVVDSTPLDSWVFEYLSNPEEPTQTLEALVDLELDRLSLAVALGEGQIERLRLAGRGDIKRFFNRVDRAKWQLRMMDDQERRHKTHGSVLLLQEELRKGLFGKESLFEKVVANSLDDQQSAALQQHLSRMRKLQTESTVRMFVAKIGWHIPLTSVQRTRLTDILLEDIDSVGSDSRYSFYIVLYRFSKVPRDQFETFFDENQMKLIVELTQAGQQLGERLKEEGLFDDES